MLLVGLCISRKVKKSESKSQPVRVLSLLQPRCVYPVKLKNLKANHNHPINVPNPQTGCVYPVKLKNLKANHNSSDSVPDSTYVVYLL